MSEINKQLLVEGNNDMHVVLNLCDIGQVNNKGFEIIDCKNIDSLFAQIAVRLKQSGDIILGIVLDADVDLTSRWKKLCSIFLKEKISLPEVPDESGTILNLGRIKIGIWIMPNNSTSGMLEDFITFLIPEGDKIKPEVAEFVKKIEDLGIHKYKDVHKQKAFVHTWLALQNTPGVPMGVAISRKFLDGESKESKIFLSWISTLYYN